MTRPYTSIFQTHAALSPSCRPPRVGTSLVLCSQPLHCLLLHSNGVANNYRWLETWRPIRFKANIASNLKVQLRFIGIHMWVVRSYETSEWSFSTKRKIPKKTHKLIHKRTEHKENLVSIFCSILMEYILNFNEYTISSVPHTSVNKRVSINLQWIIIYSHHCSEGILILLNVT